MVEAENLGGVVPVAVDTMTDTVRDAYSAWPERVFVVEDGVLVHLQGPGSGGSVDLVEDEVDKFLLGRGLSPDSSN